MTGVILAAGCGSRLNRGHPGLPKCLASLGAETLLARNTRFLRTAGVDEIVVVVGCAAEIVRRSHLDVRYVENTIFDQTNSLYSLWLARALLTDGFVVMNCDVLAHPQLAADLLSARYEDALLLAYRDEDTAYGDEEMKVQVRCGRVVSISKRMADRDADAENVGIAKFGAAGARVLIEAMDAIVGAGELGAWVPRAFEAFAARRPLHAIDTRGFPWIEIDFPDDYRRALTDVLPRIERDATGDAGRRRPPVARSA